MVEETQSVEGTGMPHLPANHSDTEPYTAVVARTDPNEQESVIVLPALDR